MPRSRKKQKKRLYRTTKFINFTLILIFPKELYLLLRRNSPYFGCFPIQSFHNFFAVCEFLATLISNFLTEDLPARYALAKKCWVKYRISDQILSAELIITINLIRRTKIHKTNNDIKHNITRD